MSAITRRFSLLTAAFPHGAYQSQGFNRPDLRAPSVKGQLRWWYDALYGDRVLEDSIFGGLKLPQKHGRQRPQSSRVIVRVRLPEPLATRVVNFMPHKGTSGVNKHCLPPGTGFELTLTPRREGITADEQQRLGRVVDAWLLLGSVGQRSNRGAGSPWPEDAPATEEDYLAKARALLAGSKLRVAVLGEAFGTDEARLRHFAGNFLAGEVFHSCRTPFGEVDSSNKIRKPSLLKLRAARLGNELRLVALWDGRWQPADTLRRGVERMAQEPDKPIGKLLLAAMGDLAG